MNWELTVDVFYLLLIVGLCILIQYLFRLNKSVPQFSTHIHIFGGVILLFLILTIYWLGWGSTGKTFRAKGEAHATNSLPASTNQTQKPPEPTPQPKVDVISGTSVSSAPPTNAIISNHMEIVENMGTAHPPQVRGSMEKKNAEPGSYEFNYEVSGGTLNQTFNFGSRSRSSASNTASPQDATPQRRRITVYGGTPMPSETVNRVIGNVGTSAPTPPPVDALDTCLVGSPVTVSQSITNVPVESSGPLGILFGNYEKGKYRNITVTLHGSRPARTQAEAQYLHDNMTAMLAVFIKEFERTEATDDHDYDNPALTKSQRILQHVFIKFLKRHPKWQNWLDNNALDVNATFNLF